MMFRGLLHALLVIGMQVSLGIGPSEAADNPQQLKAACESGEAKACDVLGQMFEDGTEVPEDLGQAVTLTGKPVLVDMWEVAAI